MTVQHKFKQIFWIAIQAYGFCVTLLTLLQVTIGEQLVIIAWFNNVSYLLWAGAIALIIPAILFRRATIICLMMIPTTVFSLNYLTMYFPQDVKPPDNAHKVTLLSYNINLAPPNIQGLVDDIRGINADIVAIQELTPQTANLFERELAEQYPYRAFHPVDSFHGQGVMSKYPIVDDEFWKIYLGHQRTSLDINGQTVTLYNVHPIHHILPFWGFDVSKRTEEVEFFLRKASQDTTPILIAGDFNMTDQSADYERITEVYGDSYKQVGYGMGTTFPAHISFLPSLLRIDYVFHSENFTPIQADVLYSRGGSDHRPLVVELALQAD